MPAPSSATIEGSMCSTEWAMKAVNTKTRTTPHLTSSRGSRIASRSSSDITSATRSGSTSNDPRNSRGNMATKTTMTTITIGAMCTRKSLNDKPARLAMMMLGGSPTRVAAPPMLEANTSAIRNGTGLIASRSHTSRVTGAINKHRGDVVQQRRGDGGDQHQQDHDPQRGTLGPFGRPDRDVLEDTGLPQHADDDHHAQQQKDDVPVDSGVVGVEHVGGADHPDGHHDRRTAERDDGLVDAVAGDQRVGDHEHGDRKNSHRISAPAPRPTAAMR